MSSEDTLRIQVLGLPQSLDLKQHSTYMKRQVSLGHGSGLSDVCECMP